MKKLSALIALLAMLLSPGLGWGQVNITPIRTDVSGFPTWTDVNVAGTTYLQLLVAGASTTTPALNLDNYTAETLDFKARTFGGANAVENTITISISTNNGVDWTVYGTALPTSTTMTAQTQINLSSYSGTQVKVKFSVAGTLVGVGAGIDDIDIKGVLAAGTPVITLAPTSLSGFTFVEGNGPSSEQTFTVSGADLTNDISISGTSSYEISKTSGSGYTTPISFTPAEVALIPSVYVRLKSGLSSGNYNSEIITATSTGATNKTVTCSGSVTAPPPPDAPVAIAASAIGSSGFTANWNAVSGATSYELDVYTVTTGANASDLFFSEYLEGGSFNKALEIYNGTGISVDLSNYTVNLYGNGATSPTATYTLTGTLADGDVYVLAHLSANAAILAVADYTVNGGVVNFNGDDAVALVNGSTNIDVLGTIGSTAKFGENVTTYLGSHTMAGGSSINYVSGYEDLNVGNVTTYDVTGLDPETDYHYVVRAVNDYGTSASSNIIDVSTTASSEITFYFRGPSWMDNNPHNPEIHGPYNGWATPPAMTYDVVPGWWSVTVEVADPLASIEFQSRFAQGGSTKYQKAFQNFGANATFTTTTGEIWIDASLNISFTWQGSDFYLPLDKITESQPIPPVPQIDWANLQSPASGSIVAGGTFDVYAQVYEQGLTDVAGQGAGITAWIGYNTADTDPTTWTNWVAATYNGDVGSNDEYMANIASGLPAGTYYYASRFQLGTADYVYGGFSGGFWDGTTNVSGVLTITVPEPSNHITDFAATATAPTFSSITVNWTDSDAGSYLIKGSDVGYGSITAPADGVAEADGALVKNIPAGVETYTFTGLNASTTYYFQIFPYNGTEITVNYKTDGSIPQNEASTTVMPQVAKVFISEYIEGSSNNKAVEIYNGEATDLDITKLSVNLFSNGASTPSSTWTGTSGILSAGTSIVIYNSAASAGIQDVGYESSTITFFNGDDALNVVYDNQVTDVFGTVGSDPGSAWDVAGTAGATVNHTIIRKLSVTQGNTNWANSAGTDVSNSEWVVMPVDYFNNLGLHGTVWTGIMDVNWSDAGNWDLGVPTSVANAIIPDVINDPVISTAAVCKDISIATSAIVEVAPTGTLTVDGTLTNNAGNTGLVVKSNATATGSLIHNTASVPATIERYVTAANWATASDGWHLLSSPVASQSISGDWIPTGIGNDYDLYAFDETKLNEYWLNQKVVANNITTFETGKAYLAAYEQSATKTFTGDVNVADVTLSGLTNTVGSAFPGWHLVGNPFASAIDYDLGTWTKTNIDEEIQVWNSVAASYQTATEVGGIVPAMNGFMVHTSGSGELIIPADSRIHDAANWYKSDEEFILVKANDLETSMSQSSIVRFNAMATDAYDADFDSYFLQGFAPAFYSTNANEVFALNTLPEISNSLVIPFGFTKNASSNFSIELAKSISGATIYLTDKKASVTTNLTEAGSYNFTASEGDDVNRFTLHFGSVGIDDLNSSSDMNVYSNSGIIYVSLQQNTNATVKVYNLTGQLVLQNNTNGKSLTTMNASSLNSGIYVVSVINGNQVISKKVVVRK